MPTATAQLTLTPLEPAAETDRPASPERQCVTVIFVDVVGSMSLSGGLEPEDWWRVMERMFALLSARVTEFGGWVESFTGDGLAAVFHTPGSHTQHARRACAAALALQAQFDAFAAELEPQLGFRLSARIGVNSGEVILGRVGQGDAARAVGVGHATGLAKRIEGIATPGTVCIGESTASLVDARFRLQQRGTFELRGARAPVTLFELTGRASGTRTVEPDEVLKAA